MLHSSGSQEDSLVLDELLALLMISNEVRMTSVIKTFKDFKRVFQVASK